LYVFGESLGSFGGEAAFSGEFDMRNRTEGALFVGPPNFNPLSRGFVDDRDAGSPEVTPVYRGGRTIRFVDRPRNGVKPVGEPWNGTRVLYMQHPSDPITWWSPELILHRPDWLKEPRGSDVSDATRWVPFVTFWRCRPTWRWDSPPNPDTGTTTPVSTSTVGQPSSSRTAGRPSASRICGP
jgi:uncharacterized membrane protein